MLNLKQTASAAYRGFGFTPRIGGQARQSFICTLAGSLLDPRLHFAILSAISQRERVPGRLYRTTGLLPNILSRPPRTMFWHVTGALPRRTFAGSLLRGTPP